MIHIGLIWNNSKDLEFLNSIKLYTLGISCYYHDSAAALLKDGHVIAAVEEERFSREVAVLTGVFTTLNTRDLS